MKNLTLCLIVVLFLFSLSYADDVAKKISVDFNGAELKSVLYLISDIATGDNINIYIDPDIKGKITIKRINTPWSVILDEIGDRFHLMAAIKGNSLFVYLPSNHERFKKQFNFDADPSSGSQSKLPPDGHSIKLTLKNGNTMTWNNYFENEDQYCTYKYDGFFCISADSVASIKIKDDNPN